MARQPNETHILMVQIVVSSAMRKFPNIDPSDYVQALRLLANEIESKLD